MQKQLIKPNLIDNAGSHLKVTIKFISITLVFLGACSLNEDVSSSKKISGAELNFLIQNAQHGVKSSNDLISGLIDTSSFFNGQYNKTSIDSFNLDTVKYFAVVLQHPNSIFNRFAIYNEYGDCFLIDKSLNSINSTQIIEVDKLIFIKIVENFNVGDSIGIVRLSLYRNIDTAFYLVYRNLAEVRYTDKIFTQTIISLNADTIKTRLKLPESIKIKEREDSFVFSNNDKIYKSEDSLFSSLLSQELKFVHSPFLNIY